MSKFPDIFLPALGGAGLVAGVAFGVSNINYGNDKIEVLESRVAQMEAQSSATEEKAGAHATRTAELEAQIAEVQAASAERAASGANLTDPAPDAEGRYGLGREAHAEEIAAWDVDVLPDGRGLPEGSGNAYDGEEVFVDRCASCHGDFAEGVDNWPVLSGGFDTLADEDPVKTVGSYWPHLSTVYDYVYRSMPFGEAGTLTPDETYAIVAYILYSNDLIDEEFELTHENLGEFDMYNKDGFVIDDRPELEYAVWNGEPCMENCKDKVEVTMRSVFLVDTPAEGGTESVMNHGTLDNFPSFTADGVSHVPVSAPAPEAEQYAAEDEPAEEEKASAEPAAEETASTQSAGLDADLVAAGEKVFKKCKACHTVGDGAKNKTGPHLNSVIGRTIGGLDGFKYSGGFNSAKDEGQVWDEANLAEFLAKPKAFMPGTKMAFSGLKKESDLAAITEYLKSFDGK